MKTNRLVFGLVSAVFGLTLATARGGEVATVTENHINVRGQPSLAGEVITQLKKGEKVSIIEEIPVEKPKKGEPVKWARIQMPANTPVWLFASYIDPAGKSVAVSRVNLRAGPGENFSVVGRLDRGETVKEIRLVEDWMEIETPDKAYAFIASEFLAKVSSSAAPTVAKSEKVEAAHEKPKTEPERPTPPTETVKVETAPAPLKDQPVAETPAPVVEKPATPPPQIPSATTATPVENSPVASNAAVGNQTAATPAIVAPATAVVTPSADPASPPKRIVRREGVVRSTKSIQAPTYFELLGQDTRRVINYLHTLDPGLKIKDFKGKKIIVTGEEGIDPRWPNTPLLEVDTIELAP